MKSKRARLVEPKGAKKRAVGRARNAEEEETSEWSELEGAPCSSHDDMSPGEQDGGSGSPGLDSDGLDNVFSSDSEDGDTDEETAMRAIAFSSSEDEDGPRPRLPAEHSGAVCVVSREMIEGWAERLAASRDSERARIALVQRVLAVFNGLLQGEENNTSENRHGKDKNVRTKRAKKRCAGREKEVLLNDPKDLLALYQLVFGQVAEALGSLVGPEGPCVPQEGLATLSMHRLAVPSAATWRALSPPLKDLFDRLIAVLKASPVSSWQLSYLLKYGLQNYYAYFVPYPKRLKELVKVLASRWSMASLALDAPGEGSDEASEQGDVEPVFSRSRAKTRREGSGLDQQTVKTQEQVRVLCFIHLKRIASLSSVANIHLITLKYAYMAFRDSMKDGSASVKKYAHVRVMALHLLELWKKSIRQAGGDGEAGLYALAFQFVREMVEVMHHHVHEPSEKSMARILSWKTILLLRFWVLLLKSNADSDLDTSFSMLVYPLVQILWAAFCTSSSLQFMPFKLHCISLLMLLSSSKSLVTGIEWHLLELLDTSCSRKPRPSTKQPKPVLWDSTIKCEADVIDTKTFQDAVVERIVYLLVKTLSKSARDFSFPEAEMVFMLKLKALLKTTRNAALLKACSVLMKTVKEQCMFIYQHRSRQPRRSLDELLADPASWATTVSEKELEGSPVMRLWRALKAEQEKKAKLLRTCMSAAQP